MVLVSTVWAMGTAGLCYITLLLLLLPKMLLRRQGRRGMLMLNLRLTHGCTTAADLGMDMGMGMLAMDTHTPMATTHTPTTQGQAVGITWAQRYHVPKEDKFWT